MNKLDCIDSFRGKYWFLSNFSDATIIINDIMYKNAEAAFQAQKNLSLSYKFSKLSASDAQKLGRQVPLRGDWEDVKDQIMYNIVFSKFDQNPHLKESLLKTGDAQLIEGNTWKDIYWGVCNGKGQNRLGQILMKVRSEIKDRQEVARSKFDNAKIYLEHPINNLKILITMGEEIKNINTSQLSWKNSNSDEGKYLTLKEISDQVFIMHERGVLYVWIENPSNGVIYQYGNHNDYPHWELHGKTKGYA